MAKENPIIQVLPTLGNQAPLAAGQSVSALANGQIGIFNFHTGLSVDGTNLNNARDIYLAVGVNSALGGTNTATDIRKTAGQFFKPTAVNQLTIKGYMPEVEKVIEITGFSAACETDYAIKLLITNQRTYHLAGFNQFSKIFTYRTPVCPLQTCDSCGGQAADPIALALNLVNNINADQDQLVVGSLFGTKIVATINAGANATGNTVVTIGTTTYTVPVVNADSATVVAGKIVAVINTQAASPYAATNTAGAISIYAKSNVQGDTSTFAVTGSGVTANAITAATKTTVTDTVGFETNFPGATLGIRITGVAETRPTFNDVNPLYAKTGTNFEAYLLDGFYYNGAIATDVTQLQYAEGLGYDIKYDEYIASGFNGAPGPYRVSTILGLAKSNFFYLTNTATNYTVIALNYGMKSQSGFEEYDADLRSIIAIPCADTTTLTGLITMFDLLFTQFPTNSTAAASITCSNTQAQANVNSIQAY
jgi:hypothetical protein